MVNEITKLNEKTGRIVGPGYTLCLSFIQSSPYPNSMVHFNWSAELALLSHTLVSTAVEIPYCYHLSRVSGLRIPSSSCPISLQGPLKWQEYLLPNLTNGNINRYTYITHPQNNHIVHYAGVFFYIFQIVDTEF